MPPNVSILQPSVRKLCQLTGETDFAAKKPAFNQTETNFGFFGTDLGSSFEHGGKLWFLFGDTWPGPGPTDNKDSVAWTTDADPEMGSNPGIHLNFIATGNKYVSPTLRDLLVARLAQANLSWTLAVFPAGWS